MLISDAQTIKKGTNIYYVHSLKACQEQEVFVEPEERKSNNYHWGQNKRESEFNLSEMKAEGG